MGEVHQKTLLSSLELSDTKVYEPQIRARLGNAARFCKGVVLQPGTLYLQLSKVEEFWISVYLADKKLPPPPRTTMGP